MALADEIVSRYRSKKGGSGESESPAEDAGEGGEPSESQVAAGKALIAAVKRGDAEAVCEAVKNIAAEY